MYIRNIINTIAQEIQSGDNTHHHDHVATTVVSVNFNTINTIVSNPAKPMPDDEEDDELPIYTIKGSQKTPLINI